LRWDPFDGERDVDIKCRTVKLVTTRKPHKCYPPEGKMHAIKSGQRARYETAIVDGEWGSYYTCLSCMDKWLADIIPSEKYSIGDI
jgi:hypothetical protein